MSDQHSQRRRLVGISTKMYFTYAQTLSYTEALKAQLETFTTDENTMAIENTDIFLIPDFLSLATVASILQSPALAPRSDSNNTTPTHKTGPILYGAQDCHSESLGAYTGEVSPQVLAELGCTFVELGHAERRRFFGETDASTAAKAAAVAKHGMIPLVCIGEKERSTQSMEEGIDYAATQCKPQIDSLLNAVSDDAEVVFAYEPVWAIGAKEPADAEYVVGVVQRLRGLIEGRARSGQVRILYGGSAKLGVMAKIGHAVDGLFLGRFAHDPETAGKIILEVAKA